MQLRLLAAFALIAPSSAVAQAPATTPAATYSYATPVAGSWSYRATATGSEAVFANTAAQPQITIRCTRSTRRIVIAKPATGAAPFLFVWTSAQTRNVPASFKPATAQLEADLPAMDPLLDTMAFSRGRLAFSASGTPALVVPAYPELSRVIEDCRI